VTELLDDIRLEEITYVLYHNNIVASARRNLIETLLDAELDSKTLDVTFTRRKIINTIIDSRNVFTPELLTKFLSRARIMQPNVSPAIFYKTVFKNSNKKLKVTTWKAACAGSPEAQEYLKMQFDNHERTFVEFAAWFNETYDTGFNFEDLNREMALSMIGIG
jgi:hypothetical protein